MTKVFESLIWTATVIWCLGLWLVEELTKHSVTFVYITKGLLFPELTERIVMKPWWLLLLPLISLPYVLLRRRRTGTVESALIFAAVTLIVLVVISFIVVIACLIPWLPHHAYLQGFKSTYSQTHSVNYHVGECCGSQSAVF